MEAVSTPPTHASLVEADIRDDRQLVDRILFLRSLTTKSPEVDSMMEALIVVTGHWKAGTALSIRDRGALDELEAKLKHHVLTVDPAHAFTAESLEQHLRQHDQQLPVVNKQTRIRTILFASLAVLVAVVLLYFILGIVAL